MSNAAEVRPDSGDKTNRLMIDDRGIWFKADEFIVDGNMIRASLFDRNFSDFAFRTSKERGHLLRVDKDKNECFVQLSKKRNGMIPSWNGIKIKSVLDDSNENLIPSAIVCRKTNEVLYDFASGERS